MIKENSLSSYERYAVLLSIFLANKGKNLIDLYYTSCSYKEDTDEGTDSDDIIEVAQDDEEAEAENRETVERVYKNRMGKKGGKSLVKKG